MALLVYVFSMDKAWYKHEALPQREIVKGRSGFFVSAVRRVPSPRGENPSNECQQSLTVSVLSESGDKNLTMGL